MPRLLLALLVLATSFTARAEEEPRIENALAISDALFATAITNHEQRFVEEVNAAAGDYVAQSGSRKSGKEIADNAVQFADARGLRMASYFRFHQDLSLNQQHEVLKFLVSPAGRAFLAAAVQASDDLVRSTGRHTPARFFRQLHALEFDPSLQVPAAATTGSSAGRGQESPAPAEEAAQRPNHECEIVTDVDAAVERARQEHAHPRDEIDAMFSDEPFDAQAMRRRIIETTELCRQYRKEHEEELRIPRAQLAEDCRMRAALSGGNPDAACTRPSASRPRH